MGSSDYIVTSSTSVHSEKKKKKKKREKKMESYLVTCYYNKPVFQSSPKEGIEEIRYIFKKF